MIFIFYSSQVSVMLKIVWPKNEKKLWLTDFFVQIFSIILMSNHFERELDFHPRQIIHARKQDRWCGCRRTVLKRALLIESAASSGTSLMIRICLVRVRECYERYLHLLTLLPICSKSPLNRRFLLTVSIEIVFCISRV